MSVRGYFDHNATTPIDDGVLAAMQPWFGERFANPSSVHRGGGEALAALERARGQVAGLLHARSAEVVFTSGGTEAANMAIFGICRGRRSGHLVASAVEHAAVLAPCQHLQQRGFSLTLLPVDGQGRVAADALRRALRPETLLAAVMHANNETGVIQPVAELAAVARERNVPFLCDAVQSAGKVPLDFAALGVDLLFVSAHKFYGPKGAGALCVRSGIDLPPLLFGGGQERGRRSGTEMAAWSARQRTLRDRIQRQLAVELPGLLVNGAGAPRLAGTLSIAIPGVEGAALAALLDQHGFSISAGSACSSRAPGPSHVLLAMGLGRAAAEGGVRISLGRDSSEEEVDALLRRLPQVARRLLGA